MRTDAILLFLAGAAFFLLALPTRDIWQPLETRYATVAREMAETGDWLIPRINGAPYQDKPPLFPWLAAVLWKIGIEAQGVRVVSALAGAATLVVVAAMARLWFSRRAAWLAAAVLATTPEFGWLGRFGELDVTLTFFTTLSVYGWFAGGKRVALFYLGIGLAVMVKGPPGILVPVVAAVAGRLARVAPSSPRAPFHPYWGPVVAVLPAACWLVPALIQAGPSYARELIGHHMFGRVVDSWQHKQPFYFYANEALWNFLPWIVLAIPAGIRAWRRRHDEPASAMFLLWFALGFAAFSAVSGKRIAYILPLAPALALLVARGVEALLVERDPPERRTAKVLTLTLCAVWAIGMALFLGALFLMFDLSAGARVIAAGFGLLLAGLAFVGIWFGEHGRRLAAALMLAVALVAGLFMHDFAFVRSYNTEKSSRPVAERMDALLPPGEGEVGIYPARPPAEKGQEQYAYSGAFNVYSERLRFVPLHDAEELRKFLASPERRLVLAGKAFVDELGELPKGVWNSPAGRTGRNEMRFLTNFPVD